MVYRTKRRVAKRARKTGKRMYRSKSRRQNRGTADKGYFEKIVISRPLCLSNLGGQSAQANIMWNACDNVTSDAYTAQFSDVGQQWEQCKTMWRMYKVVGLSIKYKPYNWNLSANQIFNTEMMNVATKMNETNFVLQNPDKMSGPLDFKAYDSKRSWKRYYKVSQWWKSQMFPQWRSTLDVNTAEMPQKLNCTTQVAMQCETTLAGGDQVGQLDLTWYIKFKQRTEAF